ncbi:MULTISPECIES: hypothetical protein [unclassified Streptomyces]|uniref:hypothetical protein n=1 Tax=unclassified Streptomyces TaxID=2593676 RepID=UPI00381D9682
MTTRCDDGPEFEPDDPLAVILRSSSSDTLGPPVGQYEAIRRAAVRRRLVRTAARAGMVCVVAVLVVLPLRLAASESPASPTVPLAPPPMRGPSLPPPSRTPATPPAPVTPRPDTTAGPSAEPPSEKKGPGRDTDRASTQAGDGGPSDRGRRDPRPSEPRQTGGPSAMR